MSRKVSSARGSSFVRRGSQKKKIFLDRVKKIFGIFFGFSLISFAVVYHSELRDKSLEMFHSVTSYLGFTLDTILISGCNRVREADVFDVVRLQKGSNIFLIDQSDLTKKMLEIPWISAIYVRRRLPSTIEFIIQEHEPLALWHNEGKVYLISKKGENVRDADIKQFKHLPSVVGKKAVEGAQYLLSVLSDYQDLYLRFKYATFVGDRRWDLAFENGVVVKLPEEKFEDSINYLQMLQENRKILDRDIESVDLRFDKKLILRKPQNVKLPGYNQSKGV